MIFTKTPINGLYVMDLEPITDVRGYFTRVFCKDDLKKMNLETDIYQVSRSLTKTKGSIRGMHFQKEPMSEVKIVQCIKGRIFDVVIDLRSDSPTFKKWFGVELSEDNKKLFYIPKGCAHGIQTLTDDCVLEYFINQAYSPQHASGVRYNDSAFNINWPLPVTVILDRDRDWPLFEL